MLAVVLALAPLLIGPGILAPLSGVPSSHSTLIVLPYVAIVLTAGLVTVRRWPRLWPTAAVLATAAMVGLTENLQAAVLFTALFAVPCALWGILLGVAAPPRLSRPGRAAALLGVAAVALLVGLRPQAGPESVLWLMGVYLVAGAIAFVPPLRTLADRLDGACGAAVASARDATIRAWGWLTARATPADAADEVEGTAAATGWRSVARDLRWPLLAWFAAYYVTSRVLLVSSAHANGRLGKETTWLTVLLPNFFGAIGKVGWGTGDYWVIATRGYEGLDSRFASFPLLALLERWFAGLFGGAQTAGVVVTTIAGLGATLLFWVWMRLRGLPVPQRKTATLILLLYPYGFLFAGVAYSDVLLLFFVMLAFVLVEADHPVLAGLAGAAATASRPNSVPLIVALVALVLTREQVLRVRLPAERARDGDTRRPRDRLPLAVDTSRLRIGHLGVLLSVAGIGAYAAWLTRVTGNPLQFLSAQAHYGHGSVTNLSEWTKVGFLSAPAYWVHGRLETSMEVLSLACLGTVAAAVPAVTRRLGVAYGIFAAGIVAIAWVGPQGFAPGARLVLPAVPFVAVVVAGWAAGRRRLLWPLLAVSAVLMVGVAWEFGLGGWGEW